MSENWSLVVWEGNLSFFTPQQPRARQLGGESAELPWKFSQEKGSINLLLRGYI